MASASKSDAQHLARIVEELYERQREFTPQEQRSIRAAKTILDRGDQLEDGEEVFVLDLADHL